MYNAFTREIERELFPALRDCNISFYVYNPLAGGILTDRYKYEDIETKPVGRFFGNSWEKAYQSRFWHKSYFEGVALVRKALNEAYGENTIPVAEAALRWLSHHSQLSKAKGDGIIIGASSMKHLESNLASCKAAPLAPVVVEAFEKAWELTKVNCPQYFR